MRLAPDAATVPHGPERVRSIRGRIYDCTDAVTPSPDHSLDTGRSPYTELDASRGLNKLYPVPPSLNHCLQGHHNDAAAERMNLIQFVRLIADRWIKNVIP